MEHVKRMNALFAACDKDNTGTLTDDEVRDFLIQMNSAMGEDDLLNFEIESAFKFILSAADTDNFGRCFDGRIREIMLLL